MNLKTVLMVSAMAVVACFGTGCGDACDDLADQLEECGVDVGEGDSDSDAECNEEAAECAATCLDENDCGKGEGYGQCVIDCS